MAVFVAAYDCWLCALHPIPHVLRRPGGSTLLSSPLWLGAAYALLPALLMNLYITGLNQLLDVDIDRVNKPQLPLASGDLSIASGVAIVLVSLAAALGLGWAHPLYATPALQATLVGSAVLGTAYSLPPLRLKRFPLFAAICIMGVRGGLINWGFQAHASAVLAAAAATSAAVAPLRCWAPVAFFTLFGVVIALVKDVPDVRGDAMFGIRSFSVRFSPRRVLRAAVALLCATYGAAATALGVGAVAALGGGAAAGGALVCARRAFVALAAALTARSVHRRASDVPPTDSDAVYTFYMYLWKCFYTAYLLLPLAR